MAHKVVATGDSQGEGRMATPQMVGACIVREKYRDDISGILKNRAFIYKHLTKGHIIEVKEPGRLHITANDHQSFYLHSYLN